MPLVSPLLVLYATGVVVGLWRVDGPPLTRVTLAALWPLGAAAAVVTTTLLLVAAALLFPVFGAILVTVLLMSWWFWP